jgi:MFS transporter, PHS family, inorganic phosphate transporter
MSVSQESGRVRRITVISRGYIQSTAQPSIWERLSKRLSERGARDNDLKKLREGYDAVEDSDTQWINWRVWAIAGSGLFLDSYNLVAINSIFPSAAFFYWKSDHLGDYRAAIDIITLLGSAIGPIVLGYLADKHGRRAVYGWELLLTLFGTWNLVLSSHSKNPAGIMLVWMTTWRLVLGIGVGSEYPLSAVITAE